MDPKDLELFNKFIPTTATEEPTLDLNEISEASGPGTNLADLILKQIAAHEAQNGEREVVGGGEEENAIEIPAKVLEVYTKFVYF